MTDLEYYLKFDRLHELMLIMQNSTKILVSEHMGPNLVFTGNTGFSTKGNPK